MKKALKRTVAVFMMATVALSAIGIYPAANATGGKISYTFKGEEKSLRGYAEGEVELNSVPDGKYYLYWADSKKALEGYYEIAQVKVKKGKGSFSFTDHTAIPAGAEKIIATANSKKTNVSDAIAIYDVPENKRLKYKPEDANYSFMNYSDIHIDVAKNQFYKYSELHFEKALETAVNRNVDFIVTAGDNINNAEGSGKEFDKFQEILANSDYVNPIYEASGNHELRTGERKTALSNFINATGLDGKKETLDKNKPYYCIEEPKTGDLFIFMSLEISYDPKTADEFSKKQLDWLEGLLEENYGNDKNIYLIEHALIKGYGAGDDKDNYYKVPLNTDFNSTNRFKGIIEKYKDIIWISGHTHIALKYGYNYSDMNSTSCHMIHDSSVCCPTLLNHGSHNLSYTAHDDDTYKDLTEGYYVQVFDDCTIFYGENLYHDKIYPSACFIIDGIRKEYKPRNNSESMSIPKNSGFPKALDFEIYATQLLEFPKSFNPVDITKADFTAITSKAKDTLENFYVFSSYNQYQRLKKSISNNQNLSGADAYKEITSAYFDLLPFTKGGEVSLYLVNTKGWNKVYARLWSAKRNNGSQGVEMERVGEDKDGNSIYKIDYNYNCYKQAVFTNGTDDEVTEEQSLTGKDNVLITVNSYDPKSPYYCLIGEYAEE